MAPMRHGGRRRARAGFVSLGNLNKVIFFKIIMRIVDGVSSRWCSWAFALIKYVPLAVKLWWFHFFQVGSTEKVGATFRLSAKRVSE